MLTTIPFAGFYQSLHNVALDDAFEQMVNDSSGCYPISDSLTNHAWRHVNFNTAHEKYAADYAQSFAKHVGCAALEFESMKSPREYNFTTDTIYCAIEESAVRALIATLPAGALQTKATERFTSRDGFSSFYSPDVTTWGDVAAWDHNQVGTVLECVADMHAQGEAWDSEDEYDLTEDLRSNGYVENWICDGSSPDFIRIVRIADYLRNRENRAYA